jgi:uncharacterized membrane protein YdjX (TVP38/TMEM64 family)
MAMHRRFWRFLWLFALLAVALGLLVWLFNLKAGFWVRVIDERGHWAQWAATEPLWARLGFVTLYVVYVLIGLPGSILLTMLGGFFFGFLHAVLLSCLAATMGAVGLIALVRVFFRPLAQARLGARYDQWAQGFRRNDLYYLLFMRLMPVFPFWVVNLVVAVMDMPLIRFAPVSFVAMMPAAMAAALVGTGLEEAFVESSAQLAACRAQGASEGGIDCASALTMPDLLQPDFLWALSLLAVMALLPPLWRRYQSVQK